MNPITIKLEEALNNILLWRPIKIYLDNKIIFDDDLELGNGWIPYDMAIRDLNLNTLIAKVEIEITQFHHSIINIYSLDFMYGGKK